MTERLTRAQMASLAETNEKHHDEYDVITKAEVRRLLQECRDSRGLEATYKFLHHVLEETTEEWEGERVKLVQRIEGLRSFMGVLAKEMEMYLEHLAPDQAPALIKRWHQMLMETPPQHPKEGKNDDRDQA